VKLIRKITDLPRTLALFPLTGAIVFPRGHLPLNIFEPRYLNMVDDALASERLIGMIQPSGDNLCAVGAVGRITSFSETDDGRYLITLTGLCRYRVAQELKAPTPYRQALVDYDDFASDLRQLPQDRIDRDKLRFALRRYVDLHGYEADWSAVDDAPPETLVNTVAALCPFDSSAKQALLEAPSIADRCDALIALLEWGATGDTDGRLQ
jgi:uncharacterized protein